MSGFRFTIIYQGECLLIYTESQRTKVKNKGYISADRWPFSWLSWYFTSTNYCVHICSDGQTPAEVELDNSNSTLLGTKSTQFNSFVPLIGVNSIPSQFQFHSPSSNQLQTNSTSTFRLQINSEPIPLPLSDLKSIPNQFQFHFPSSNQIRTNSNSTLRVQINS